MSTHHTTDMLQLFIEITSLLIALAAGLFAYRFMTSFFRLLFWQLIVWIVVYGFGYLITTIQAMEGKPADNQWLMNIHILLESGLLIAAARIGFPSNIAKSLARWACIVVLIVFLVSGFRWGFTVYLNAADLAACIVVVLLYLRLLYRLYQEPVNRFPEKLACFGILAYFASSVPYVGFMYFIREYDPLKESYIYHLIIDSLANLRYVLLAWAFWQLRRSVMLTNQKP